MPVRVRFLVRELVDQVGESLPVMVGEVLQALRQVIVDAENLSVHQDRARELHVAYLEWVNTAPGQLRRQISSADLDRLVTTDRYSTVLPYGVIRQRGLSQNPDFPRGAITIDLWPDPPGHVRLPRADDEIIARAVAFQALAGRKVTLLTGDIGMSTRARMADLEAIRLDLPDAARKPPKPPRGTKHPDVNGGDSAS